MATLQGSFEKQQNGQLARSTQNTAMVVYQGAQNALMPSGGGQLARSTQNTAIVPDNNSQLSRVTQDSSAGDNTAKSIQEMDDAQKKSNKSVWSGVSNAIKLASSFISVSKAIAGTCETAAQFYDTMVRTNAQLGRIGDGMQSAEALQSKVAQAAQHTGTSYSDMAASVIGLRTAAGGVFNNNDEAIRFSQLMRQAFTIAGASAEQANGSMDSLTQALADGTIQGDEFGSILQSAPVAAQALADHLQTNVAALQTMATQEGISADVFRDAMFGAADAIEARYNTMPMTFGQIWNNIQTGAMDALGPVLGRFNEIASSKNFDAFVNSLLSGIENIAWVLSGLITIILFVASLFTTQWTVFEPIIWGIAAAIAAYAAILLVLNARQAISNGLAAVAAFRANVQAAKNALLTGTTFAQIVAQKGLNVALLASPITWFMIIIIGLVAAIAVLAKRFEGLRNILNKIGGFFGFGKSDQVQQSTENYDYLSGQRQTRLFTRAALDKECREYRTYHPTLWISLIPAVH